MYDFEERRDGGSTEHSQRFPKPPLALTALELARVLVEYPTSAVIDALLPTHSVGQGRPVLVLPGFYASDAMTGRLRSHLRGLGYRAHGWKLGRNFGLTDHIVTGLPDRLDQLDQRYGSPVSVVGWSFGGLLARWLAHERPDAVHQVICLGSPWRPEGEVTRTTALFERAAQKYGLADSAREIVDTLRGPLPVRCTAIYSKTDGIVNWRSCALDANDDCESISVPSSHVGLVSNPLALAVLADRLAQNPLAAEPFEWGRCLRRTVLGPPSDVASITGRSA
jgi:pimeloyl-ACP methyl ester carboxylesterase